MSGSTLHNGEKTIYNLQVSVMPGRGHGVYLTAHVHSDDVPPSQSTQTIQLVAQNVRTVAEEAHSSMSAEDGMDASFGN